MPKPINPTPPPTPTPDPMPTPTPPPSPTPLVVTAATPMRAIGDLPRSAWASALQGSPMLGELDAIMAAASPYGALCLCQAKRESSYGRDASAQRARNAWGIMTDTWGTLQAYPSWASGAATFKRILDNETIYPPHDITMLDYVRTYVGGPRCRTSGGVTCADPNATGPNPKYLVSLLADLNALLAGTTPAPPAPPIIDPIAVIVGGKPYSPITYGWLADAGLNYYCYGVNHGTTACTQHTGVDVPVPRGTALFAPVSGVVDCVGDAGLPRWGEGCGAYPDQDGSGKSGNLTLLLDSGHKLVLGHCSSFAVSVGARVQAGQKVASSGGMNGPHVHVEVAVNKNGTYWLVEPIAALTQAMGGQAPTVYAERVPISQPDPTPPYWVVRVTADSLPVLQTGDAKAPAVAPPLGKDETFNAQYTLPGTDGKGYWVSTLLGRVPIDGTKVVKVVTA